MPGQLTLTVAEYRALLRQQAGLPAEPPTPTRQQTEAAARQAEAQCLETVRAIAQQHDWSAEYSWNAAGPDSGLRCWLVREAVLLVQVLRPGTRLSAVQQRWLERVRATGQVATYVCGSTPQDLEPLRARLTRPQEAQHAALDRHHCPEP